MLLEIKGIGPEFAAILWMEAFFRSFADRRQVAAYAGLAPTPWQSGSVDREQGVSKAGNPRLRTTLIQLAWLSTGSGFPCSVFAKCDEKTKLGKMASRCDHFIEM
jgi:transposase